jgi:hypothetical protein
MDRVSAVVKLSPLAAFFGIAYATSFAGGYLSQRYPSDGWAVFVYGPFLAGLVVTAVDEGRDGLKVWLGRIVRWRVGRRWYAVALLLPVLLRLIAFGLNLLFGAAVPAATPPGGLPALIPEFLFILLFIGLAEEPGFRGFALQRLVAGRTALAASLILGVLVTLWHGPLFVSGSEPLTIVPVILAGSVLLAWVYLGTGGSVLLTMLMHASVNTANGYFSALFSGAELARQTALLAVVYVAAALILVAVTGPQLVRRPAVRPAEA